MTSIFDIKRTIGGFKTLHDSGLKDISDAAVIEANLRATRSLFIAMRHSGIADECSLCEAILPQQPYKSIVTVGGNRCCVNCAPNVVNDTDLSFDGCCYQVAAHVCVTDQVAMGDVFRREWKNERDNWITCDLIRAQITLIKQGLGSHYIKGLSEKQAIERAKQVA